MNEQLKEFIKDKYGYSINTNYYGIINEWESWWRGYNKEFHEFTFNNGIRKTKQQMFTLKMAKKVAEDWASLLLNEKTEIIIDDEKSSQFIQGINETSGILGENNFIKQGNALIEKSFAFGTGAISIRIENATVTNDGSVQSDADTKIRLNYIQANQIIPLTWENEQIIEVAFASKVFVKGKPHIYLEIHHFADDKTYVIDNHYFNVDQTFKEVELPDGMVSQFFTQSTEPLFAIFKPNIVNPIKGSGAFGYSVYGNAINNLKGVDLAFHNFCTDLRLGQKKVFMNKSLLAIDNDGNEIAPDDINQQLFSHVGDGMESGQLIQEFNPALRVTEDVDAIQAQLDFLSFKCGLGAKHYQFDMGGTAVITATQYVGDKQDLMQNVNKHYLSVKDSLEQLVRGILIIGQKVVDATLNTEVEISIEFDDSFIVDKEAILLGMQSDVASGILKPEIYLAKKYGKTEEEAILMMPRKIDSLRINPFGINPAEE